MATALVAGTSALTPGVHARAATADVLVCTAGGSLAITSDLPHHWVWALSGSGQCLEGAATDTVTVTGAGTSDGLGLCDGSGVVSNLNLDVTLTLTNSATGVSRAEEEHWQSQVTTFPLATPFTVVQNFLTVGLGNLDTHVFLKCPPGGTPVADMVWAQVDNIS